MPGMKSDSRNFFHAGHEICQLTKFLMPGMKSTLIPSLPSTFNMAVKRHFEYRKDPGCKD